MNSNSSNNSNALGLLDSVVKLVPHDSDWDNLFEKEKELILKKVSGIFDIEHCGSTSLPNIVSKPIMNIAVSVLNVNNLENIITDFKDIGYEHKPSNFPDHELFEKREKNMDMVTHHIHVMTKDGNNWNKTISFRDHLIANPSIAKEYENLKKKLAKQFPSDRESYAKGKNPFFDKILRKIILEVYQ